MTQNERSHNYSKQITFKQFDILDEEQQIVEGYVTDDKIDVDGHVIDQAGFRSAVTDYLSWGNIREQHMLPAGLLVDTPEWNKFVVRIVDDNVWKKVKAGLYKGFSVGIRVLDYEVEPLDNYTEADFAGLPAILKDAIKTGGMIIRITKMVLAEVSIVDRPANPRALVTAFKAEGLDNTETLPVFKYVAEMQKELKGVNQMAKSKQEDMEKDVTENSETVDVADNETVDEVVDETVEKSDGAESVDLEAKFASLEKTVNDLNAQIETVAATVDSFEKTVTDIVTKALESIIPAQAETEDEVADEAVVEDETVQEDEAEVVDATEAKSVETDIEGVLERAFAGLDDKIANAIAKAIADRVAEQDAAERQGAVNGGDVDEDVTKSDGAEVKTVPSLRKAALAAMTQMQIANGVPVTKPE